MQLFSDDLNVMLKIQYGIQKDLFRLLNNFQLMQYNYIELSKNNHCQ
jgi:hypothetical protein